MTVTLDIAKAHLNVTGGDDDALITAQIAAAGAFLAAQLGFAIDDDDQFPDGTPADLDQAVLMLIAHWYAQREASFVNTAAQAIEVPFGVSEIIANYRTYSFGLADATS
jgi:uncharacterized phiE125 gp8 family phage protein